MTSERTAPPCGHEYDARRAATADALPGGLPDSPAASPAAAEALVTTHQAVRPAALAMPRAHAARWKHRFRTVGLLTPVSPCYPQPIECHTSAITLGRGRGATIDLRDASVSRLHARIYRQGDEFILEDLGSSNGTFLDGAPVVSCVLRGGDEIQIGRCLFYFDRLLEPVHGAEEPPS